ncbi:xylose isomerase-like [Arachis duranensis]|uniref:Xylose isomerase n=1 Tax=Arachis duranensis TaxID=130453 RepID=A0A6P4CP98_ARADU|nr:xylose isomerase-like [Arachis duranensis]
MEFELDAFSPEILNGINCSSLPPHKLVLKVGAPVMLLRNIDQTNGVYNGTRMQVRRMGNHVIECKTLTGNKAGSIVLIPRLNLISNNETLPVALSRVTSKDGLRVLLQDHGHLEDNCTMNVFENIKLIVSEDSIELLFNSCLLQIDQNENLGNIFAPSLLTSLHLCSDREGEFFPGINKIKYEGPSSKNPLSFKWYNAEEEILGKKMKDWFRFSVAFWHTFRGTGADPFGAPTKHWPWEDGTNSVKMAKRRMRANFEFINKLGIDLWCFHDRDIAPDGESLEEANANLDEVVALAKELQTQEKKKVLWGTAQLFMHPRYMHGAATSSELGVYAYAATQVKKAMEVYFHIIYIYVFWGGREGYQSLLNTDMERELNHLARFFEAAVAYKKKIGFNGTLLIEPKPQEPTKHQYDWDAATTSNFLRKYGLIGEFKLNIECNHATLSGHSCHHELETARINGLLGNIDANTGDPQVGWDTDQFLVDIQEATMIMLSVVRNGGIAPGGFNFDAKLRRESMDVEDLFIAHIIGMDTMARGLKNVAKLVEDGALAELVRKRYQSFDTKIGAQIEAGKADFDFLEKKVKEWGEPKVASAKQELAEMILQSAL